MGIITSKTTPPPDKNKTCKLGRVTHQRLQKFWNQDQGAEKHEAHHEHH